MFGRYCENVAPLAIATLSNVSALVTCRCQRHRVDFVQSGDPLHFCRLVAAGVNIDDVATPHALACRPGALHLAALT